MGRNGALAVALAAGWVIVAGGLGWWLTHTSPVELRDQLRRWEFWVLEGQFILLCALSAANLPRLVRSLRLTRTDLRLPILGCVLGFALVTWGAPRTSRIYFDEQIYQSIGQNMSDLHLAQMCSDGDVEYGTLQCRVAEYNKEPYGYPYVLSLAYRVFGVHDGVAYALNAVALAATVWVVFLLAMRFGAGARAAGLAALVAALIPEFLRWSHSASAEPTAALMCGVAVLAAREFTEVRSTRALFWAVAATAFGLQFRTEGVLLVPLVALVVMLYAPAELRRQRIWWGALCGLLLVGLYLGHLVAIQHETWGASGPRMALSYLAENLRTNGWFYLMDKRFPVVYTLAAAWGVVAARNRRDAFTLVMYFALFWGIFLIFYAGSYDYGADVRFSLMTYVPIAVLAGIGLDRLAQWVPARVVVAGVLAQIVWYLPYVRSVGEEAWAARADVAFAHDVARTLPKNSIVFTHNPSMFHIWGVNAAQMSLLPSGNQPSRNLADRYAGGVYLHWGFWCNVDDPAQRKLCEHKALDSPAEPIAERRVRDYRLVLYRLRTQVPRP